MADREGAPLRLAKSELKRSLSGLRRTQQFQVAFYHHQVRWLRLPGLPEGMMWANQETLRRARAAIDETAADGGTNHHDALLAAFRLEPDEVYLLTDADRPQLSPLQVKTLLDRNPGCRIHAIELSLGARESGVNPLQALAESTGGEYRHVDVLDGGSGSREP